MKLTFDNPPLLKRLIAASVKARKRRPAYSQITDFHDKEQWKPREDVPPGLLLVGDHGVYLMTNATPGVLKPDGSGHSEVIYANGINPDKDDGWWEAKRETFGGDDGVEFIDLPEMSDGDPVLLEINIFGDEISATWTFKTLIV
jgi:hypothetical protein